MFEFDRIEADLLGFKVPLPKLNSDAGFVEVQVSFTRWRGGEARRGAEGWRRGGGGACSDNAVLPLVALDCFAAYPPARPPAQENTGVVARVLKMT